MMLHDNAVAFAHVARLRALHTGILHSGAALGVAAQLDGCLVELWQHWRLQMLQDEGEEWKRR